MEWTRSRAAASALEELASTGSTNDELVRRATSDTQAWPDGAVLVTRNQTAGHGRLGRTWTAPPGTGLAVSILVRPTVPEPGLAGGTPLSIERFSWLPLLAGLAATRAVSTILSEAGATSGRVAADSAGASTPRPAVELKWPNDVLIEQRKVCGVLAELLPDATGVVIGAGINLTVTEAELPTETATSLVLAGVADPDPDAVLATYLTEFFRAYRGFVASEGDPEISGLRADVKRVCGTLGRRVRVELPGGGGVRTGTATDIDSDGRLVVSQNGDRLSVAAGDVTHLRY